MARLKHVRASLTRDADHLQAELRRRGWSPARIAKVLDLSRSTVSTSLRNIPGRTSARVQSKAAQILGTPRHVLFPAPADKEVRA